MQILKVKSNQIKQKFQIVPKVLKKEEWEQVLSDGLQALRKVLGPVKEDPKFFMD